MSSLLGVGVDVLGVGDEVEGNDVLGCVGSVDYGAGVVDVVVDVGVVVVGLHKSWHHPVLANV